ncbi:hypothetical protein ACGFNV_14435 [Streptomyces sp. NPDC048751]|uniref:DUF4760 domain-containing protein n=1 Tax=Streptomyces sp. NPDC048751 TaxID=3365591 RepID=UPI0037189299
MFNLVATGLSAVALLVTLYSAVSQAGLQRRSNQLPAYVDLLADFRSAEFHERYSFVTQRLLAEYDPTLGLSGLPNDVRRQVYDIVYYYQNISVLRLADIVDDEMVALLRIRVVKVWDAVAPFVLREREVMGTDGRYLLRGLEDMAHEARHMPQDLIDQLMHVSRTQPAWRRHRAALRRRAALRQLTAPRVPPPAAE